jgi:hypothetical protein
MATSATNVGIKNSWSLIGFKNAFGKLSKGKATNRETGEVFDSLCFENNEGARTFVSFSSNLGVLSSQEIIAQKDNLQVVLLDSGNYKLCKKGESSWETIDL